MSLRLAFLALLPCVLAAIPACTQTPPGDGGAAHIGAVVRLADDPDVTVNDEFGTDVRVFVEMDHMGGPDVETLEVVGAQLSLDLEPYADLELAIPEDHSEFPGLVDGETFDFELRGSLPDNHDDWGLCDDPAEVEADGYRVTLDLTLRVAPGANDEDDVHSFESRSVAFHCSHAG